MMNASEQVAGPSLETGLKRLDRLILESVRTVCELVLDKAADVDERVEAAEWLAVSPHPAAIPAILLALQDLGPGTLREVLHRFEPGISDTALAWLTDDDRDRRAAATLAFMELQNPWSVEPLLKLEVEADPEVRAIECFALAHQAPAEAMSVLTLVGANDLMPTVRSCAHEALQRLEAR